jgi:hypothetical protein
VRVHVRAIVDWSVASIYRTRSHVWSLRDRGPPPEDLQTASCDDVRVGSASSAVKRRAGSLRQQRSCQFCGPGWFRAGVSPGKLFLSKYLRSPGWFAIAWGKVRLPPTTGVERVSSMTNCRRIDQLVERRGLPLAPAARSIEPRGSPSPLAPRVTTMPVGPVPAPGPDSALRSVRPKC